MNSDILYKRFNQESLFIADNFEKLIRLNNWYDSVGFSVIRIDKRIWLKEPVLEKINNQFTIENCGILRIDSFINYNWHTDFTRGLTVNMLLKQVPGYSLFGFDKDQFNTRFHELKYELKKFYLFNTQHIHSVVNFDEPRYVFSVKFEKNKDELLYPEVFDWCMKEGMFDD